jgi:hypothetical protein
LAAYRRVAILCPTDVTGGPQALHQLGFALNRLGVAAEMVYLGAENAVELHPGRIVCRTPRHEPTMAAYAAYAPRVAGEIALDETTLVVLPELHFHLHSQFRHCAVWWLSVDNALRPDVDLRDAAVRAQLFGRDDLVHLYQSVYAREWLRINDARRMYDLYDYTDETFTTAPAQAPSPEPFATFNLHKGRGEAEAFFAAHPRFAGLGLGGFSRPQLRDIFARRLLYVDFGHFPGKDRLPREAALAGAVVFVSRRGAGAYYDDFPIPNLFKFDPADVQSGELARRLDRVVADPQGAWARQDHFRRIIAWEKAQFFDQLNRLWGRAPPV